MAPRLTANRGTSVRRAEILRLCQDGTPEIHCAYTDDCYSAQCEKRKGRVYLTVSNDYCAKVPSSYAEYSYAKRPSLLPQKDFPQFVAEGDLNVHLPFKNKTKRRNPSICRPLMIP